MYQPRTPNYRKSDPVMRWNLPDRIFFACGACHILAHAFIERFDAPANSLQSGSIRKITFPAITSSSQAEIGSLTITDTATTSASWIIASDAPDNVGRGGMPT